MSTLLEKATPEHEEYRHGVDDEEKDLKQDVGEVRAQAIRAEQAERTGVWRAVRLYPGAVFWSLMLSMCVVMEAYDYGLISNLIAQASFQKAFGHYVPATKGYQLDAAWQSGIKLMANAGLFAGILTCGYIQQYLGFKKTTLLGLVGMIGAIFPTVFAPNVEVLSVGEMLCGFFWGFFINLAPAYASEVAPLPLRGVLTMYIQVCWQIGGFICAGVMYSVRSRPDEWGWKIPLAVQWVWPLPLIAFIAFAPESPWWLVRKGRLDEAAKMVERLGGNKARTTEEVIAMMVRTHEIESAERDGANYISCFRGTDLRRTTIATMIFPFSLYSGLFMGNYATYFFSVAGMSPDITFGLGLGISAIGLVAVFVCWVLISYFGRRTLYLWGTGVMLLCLLLTGVLACLPKNSATLWTQSVFVILTSIAYSLTVGPLTYGITAEISSVKLRVPTIAIARAAFYLNVMPTATFQNYALNPTALNLGGKTAFIWLGTGLFVFVWSYFFLPETKDRSYRELDILFHRRVPARQFASTKIEEQDDE